MAKEGYTYIMANTGRTTFYIGVTADLEYRVLQHKAGVGSSFTRRYHITKLVYFEDYQYIQDAIAREKQLKNWRREWKIELIKTINPAMEDLAKDWFTRKEVEDYRLAIKSEPFQKDPESSSE